MSDQDQNAPGAPTKSTTRTSTVPLKKETVRITLRAKPGTGVTQAREVTTPVPSGSPTEAAPELTLTRPTVIGPPVPPPPIAAAAPPPPPGAPRPPIASSATVPLRPGAPPPPAGAPPRPLGAPSAPRPAAPMGATTIPMTQAPGSATKPLVPGAPTVPLSPKRPEGPGAAQSTTPLRPGAPAAPPSGSTTQMPQATVGMRPTGGPPVAARPTPTRKVVADTAEDDEPEVEARDPNAGIMPLAIAALLVALALAGLVMLSSDKLTSHPKGEDSALTVPEAANPDWEVQDADTGKFSSVFESKTLPAVPTEPGGA